MFQGDKYLQKTKREDWAANMEALIRSTQRNLSGSL